MSESTAADAISQISIPQNLLDLDGEPYHLSEHELRQIAVESDKALQNISSERDSIKMQIDFKGKEKKVDYDEIAALNRDLSRLDRLEELENPIIKAAVVEIMKYHDPIKFILKVYNKFHVGDINIGRILILSKASQSILNTSGIQPKLTGASSSGKTHAATTMYILLPDTGHKIEGSISSKNLFYDPDMKPGMIVFNDDVRMTEELDEMLKITMSKFQFPTHHRTVDRNLKPITLEIPERCVFWLTSVKNPFSDELMNRLYNQDVDGTEEQDAEIIKRQRKAAVDAEDEFPEDDSTVMTCRGIFYELEKQLFKVRIPYGERIEWPYKGDRRNFPKFLALIRGFCAMRFMQRDEEEPGIYAATMEDFIDAKNLWEAGETFHQTKLTKAEVDFCEWFAGKGPLTINEIINQYKKPNGKSYTFEYIRKLLNGNHGRGGLIDKVGGLLVLDESMSCREDNLMTVSKAKRYQLEKFDKCVPVEGVYVKPE